MDECALVVDEGGFISRMGLGRVVSTGSELGRNGVKYVSIVSLCLCL